jgi:hypothetical protein
MSFLKSLIKEKGLSMKKVIFFLLLVVVAIGVYFSFISSERQVPEIITLNDIEQIEDDLDEETLLEELIEEKEENLSIEDIEKALDSEDNELMPQEVVPEMVADALDIMVEREMADVEKNFPSKEGIKPITAIEIAKNSVANLNIGDTVSLPYMGTGQFDAKITSKTTHTNGSVTVSGNLVDADKQYSVVLTEGKNMTFGTITTPNGSYEIEAKDGQGYVYSTSDIDKEWIDYDKSDTLTPHEHDH